ncbi:hypothetical protein NQ314_002811 [Rhamnusium bicolor]|uniref:Uncharacterized protein n=1 Tax=Rhamnusium bicolor TaxID=1586634 RepID=A0AAV8ZQA6_9CUCU|nr:hypothetical protein NQ314_002811 [Rhamnusium bicolor]
MSLCLFQQRCGYVTHKCDLIPGLTVEQTLYYTPTKLTGYLKKSKVKQVMADLALSQVSNRCTEDLTQSEYRRLMIVCLSTVDRRSRERFVESNHQISALVEKFKIEGGAFRKGSSVTGPNHTLDHGMAPGNKVPLLLGRTSSLSTGWAIYM